MCKAEGGNSINKIQLGGYSPNYYYYSNANVNASNQ